MIARGATLAALVGLLASLAWLLAPPRPAHPDLVQPFLVRMDADGDGQIGADEYARIGSPSIPLATLDADGDGVLGAWEVDAFLTYVDPTVFGCQALSPHGSSPSAVRGEETGPPAAGASTTPSPPPGR